MTTTIAGIRRRVDDLDWEQLTASLDTQGHAITDAVLEPDECRALAGLFEAGHFRSTIEMARHRFGDGRYRYFDHPLPPTIAELRSSFYGHLAPIANRWGGCLEARIRPSPYATRNCWSVVMPPGRRAPPR